MRIAHILPTLAAGGVRRYVQYACNRRDGVARPLVVGIFSHPTGASFPLPDSEEVSLELPSEAYVDRAYITSRLVEVFRSQDIDLVHSHHFFTDIYALPAAQRASVRAKLRTIHGVLQISPNNGFRKTFVRYDWSDDEISDELAVEECCDVTVCVSEDVRVKAIRYGIPAAKTVLIANGVDTKVFSPVTSAQRAAQRANFGLSSGDVVVGFLGRLEPAKNVMLLVGLCRYLCARDEPFTFLVVGSGPEDAALAEAIVQNGIAKHFRVLPQAASVSPIYEVADIVIVPSHVEGCPYVVLEAMSCGLPVVATAVGGIPEVIENGVDGLLFEVGDVASAATHLVSLRSPIQRKEVGARARRKMLAKFEVKKKLAELDTIYFRLLGA